GRFERGHSGRNYPGLGLGLYITRQIVTAMEGTISVESAPGEGSIFTVVLPRRLDQLERRGGGAVGGRTGRGGRWRVTGGGGRGAGGGRGTARAGCRRRSGRGPPRPGGPPR